MINTRENVAQTAQRIISNRPVLEPIIKSFEKVFDARATLPKTLLPLIAESGLKLPEFNEEYAEHGRALLSGMSLTGLDKAIGASAKVMLPLLAEQEYLKPFMENLENYFTPKESSESKGTENTENTKDAKNTEDTEQKINSQAHSSSSMAEAYIANNATLIEEISAELNVPEQALLFAFHFILAPVLQALVLHSVPAVALQALPDTDLDGATDQKDHLAPWDKNALWKEGYCPICASFPSISYLDRALLDENNQFLAGGGGKKFLHCSLCGTNWHFKRGMCPACKEEGTDVIEILKETKTESGERIDFCTKCHCYCPNIDLRISGKRPDFDTMALGMLHLDMIAAEKKLTPLNPSFWNTF